MILWSHCEVAAFQNMGSGIAIMSPRRQVRVCLTKTELPNSIKLFLRGPCIPDRLPPYETMIRRNYFSTAALERRQP